MGKQGVQQMKMRLTQDPLFGFDLEVVGALALFLGINSSTFS